MDVVRSELWHLNDFKFNPYMGFGRNFILEAGYFKLCFQILETMHFSLLPEEFLKWKSLRGFICPGSKSLVKLDLSSQCSSALLGSMEG